MSRTHTIVDDDGNEHAYEVEALPALKASELWSQIEQVAAGDWLDQVLDGALAKASGADQEAADAAAVEQALDQTASRVARSGNTELIVALLEQAVRDGELKLTRQAIQATFAGNLGELEKALRLVIAESYRPFCSGRCIPLRAWGRQLVDHALAILQRTSEMPSELSASLSGLFGGSGWGPVKALASSIASGRGPSSGS